MHVATVQSGVEVRLLPPFIVIPALVCVMSLMFACWHLISPHVLSFAVYKYSSCSVLLSLRVTIKTNLLVLLTRMYSQAILLIDLRVAEHYQLAGMPHARLV